MSEQGRCAGCRETGDLKKVSWHVLACLKWAQLYRENPAAALSPAQEYARWYREERAVERAADLGRRIADTQARRKQSVDRFKVPDPLGD